MAFALQFLRKNPGAFLMAMVFLEMELMVCLLTGILLLWGGVR